MDRYQGWFRIWWMTGSPFYNMQENNLDQAVNMKLLLCAFEQLSGLKINFHKSELFCFGEAKNQLCIYSQIFGCGMGTIPFKYLGIPMHF